MTDKKTDRNRNTGVPGIPLHALNAIQDENVRAVLQAIVDGWNVRNGHAGKGDNRFITAAEVENIRGSLAASLSGKLGQTGVGSGDGGLGAGKISQIINDLQASIMESQLWIELGERIKLIDLNLIKEQQQRIREVQEVADELLRQAEELLEFEDVTGSKIATVEKATEDQAIVVSGLTTRIKGAESTIVSLGQTTASQAQTLNSLTTRVGGAESSISTLNTTTANQAQTLNSLTTRVGGAESSISTLNTTTANQANSLSSLSSRIGSAESAITSEQTTRANADNALSTKIDTQMSAVNKSIAAVQTEVKTATTNTSALSTKVDSLNTTLGSVSTAVQTEATARQTADNDMYAKYTVKIDQNGYVSGYGLMSTANNSTPMSEFIVRADRFAIGSPSGAGISPQIPFVAITTPQTVGGKYLRPGVYIKDGFIGRLQVDRLEIMALGGYFSVVNFKDGVCSGTVHHNSGRAVLPYAAMVTASYYPITGWVVTSAGTSSFNYILYAFNGKGEGLTGPMAISWGYM